MAENALSPAFVKINYQTAFGSHSQTIPTVPYILPDIGNISGQFDLRGAALSTPAGDAIEEFVNLEKVYFPASTTFIDYTIFTQADATSVATPRYSAPLGIVGTAGVPIWTKATQATLTFRTEEFGLFKLVWLDFAADTFDRIASLAGRAGLAAIVNYVTADVSWMSGRDDARPTTWLQMSTTLNERLRRAYGMT